MSANDSLDDPLMQEGILGGRQARTEQTLTLLVSGCMDVANITIPVAAYQQASITVYPDA
jgi:hypothetical protein